MADSINKQKPATTNQISNEKPQVKKSTNLLEGYIANSLNGGIVKPIAYKRVMGGEFIRELRLSGNFRLLTPKTPAYQNLTITFKTFFCPDSAVWTNAEKFYAQKGGSTVTKITEEPNLGGKVIPRFQYSYTEGGQTKYKNINWTDTDAFRDSYVSTFLPRYLTGYVGTSATIGTPIALPKVSVLPIRAAKKCWNEHLRNREYEAAKTEYTGDTVTNNEWYDYIGYDSATTDYMDWNILRGRRANSYYTDYRTELLGASVNEPSGTGARQMVDMVEWEKLIAEYRSQSQDSQMEDRMVVAKIRGTRPVKDGKCRLISQRTIPLNYSAITQSTYNTNQNIQAQFQAMGEQGAYSYTYIDKLSIAAMEEFIEDGTLITWAQISADSVFETGFDRTMLDVSALSKYRPDLKEMKDDVLYEIEKGTTNSEISTLSDLANVQGYKRRFSEWFKLPNAIGGDMTTNDFYETDDNGQRNRIALNGNVIITQKTFTFFEESDKKAKVIVANGQYFWTKRIWKDYTDLLIDKNQAVQNGYKFVSLNGTDWDIMVRGQNQIFFVGILQCIDDLPIDESIKNDFTLWGEK